MKTLNETFCVSLLILFLLSINPSEMISQECDGAEILTYESYLFGRFEVRMQSASGGGIISSFFLFNNSSGCNYPEENNEIDVEMTGNNDKIYFTSHHPGNPNAWYYGENFELGFSPHEGFHDYAIEWEPGIIRWFVDGELIYVQDDAAAEDLMYPMAIYMNIWASGSVDWAGIWDPSVMPRRAIYDYVKYYKYLPEEGDHGTGNNFTLEWEDHFEALDSEKWRVSDFKQFDLNYCTYRSGNIAVDNGFLNLTIDEPQANNSTIPVTFSVNTTDLNLISSDQLYLNGLFNEWCGDCNPMIQNGDVWELTLDLVPGRYEYLFTVNTWEKIGSVPLNSDCDFSPCDEFGNYGFILSAGTESHVLETSCWSSCNVCQSTDTKEINNVLDKKLLGVFDISGRETQVIPNQLLFYLYSDGSVEKKITWDF